MRSAIKNFLIVTWVSLMCAFIGWSYLRHKALAEPIKTPLEHPFLKGPASEVVAFRSFDTRESSPYYSLKHLNQVAEISNDLILWIDIHPLDDGSLVAGNNDMDSVGAPSLDEVLSKFPNNRLILNFRANRPQVINVAIASIEKAKANNRVLIQSPEEEFLKNMRETRPLWLFGTSQAQVTRMIMLAAIGLEAAAPLKGDLFVMETDANDKSMRRLDDAIIREVHRRKLKIFAGPVDAKEASQLRIRGLDGVLTTDPKGVLNQAPR
jgi:hypothetical protein